MSGTPTQIGPYTIEAEVGRGGMGVVYRATDTRLDRAVAIKALPEHFADDPDRLARFEREAKTLASLNHPNIAQIYGVEEADGRRYLVLELVDGDTLADRLDRGALPVDEAIEICEQIAAGVEAAHEAGVIHRDLKPANVKITPEGRVKVLDFGLARMDESASSSGAMSMSPTLTSPVQHSPTVPGMIMGTAAYMSPEQARGRAVDRRTDIWSFGVVLFECLTGASPFVGETVSDSIGAILHKHLDFDRLPPDTPRALRRVLERCVVRDKQQRYRDIGDVRLDLLRARDGSVDAPPAPAPAGARPLRWAAVGALVVVALGAGWFGATMNTATPARPIVKIDLVRDTETTRIGDLDPKISPDGRFVAYGSDNRIQVRELATFESRTLPGAENATGLFWSPDSAWLGFHTASGVFKVPLAGGAATRLTPASARLSEIVGGAWLADGRIIFGAGEMNDDAGLMQVSSLGGEVSMYLPNEAGAMIDFHDVRAIHGTNTVILVRHKSDLALSIEVYDGRRTAVVVDEDGVFIESPAWSPSGHVLYTRSDTPERSVWAQPFDLESMQAIGEPVLVQNEAWAPSVSQRGDLVLRRGADPGGASLAWVTSAGEVTTIDTGFDDVFGPIASPDGARIVFANTRDRQRFDLWVHDLQRGVNQRITFLERFIAPMFWSPDGREIAATIFDPLADPPLETQFFHADGSGESRPGIHGMLLGLDESGELGVVISRFGAVGISAVRLNDPDDEGAVVVERASNSSPKVAALSPDGSLLAYISNESGEPQVYCTTFPGGGGKWQVSTSGGVAVQWAADGARLYFESPDEDPALYAVEVEREPALRFGLPQRVLDARGANINLDAGWSPPDQDGRFLVTVREEEGLPFTSLSIIQNWASMLERR